MVGLARQGIRPGGVLVLAERDGVSKLCRWEGELRRQWQREAE